MVVYTVTDGDDTTVELVNELAPYLKKYGAVYINGHEHNVEVIQQGSSSNSSSSSIFII